MYISACAITCILYMWTIRKAYLFQSFFTIVQGGPKVVSVHDGFEMVHGCHAVGQVNYVSTAGRALHVSGEIQGNRGKEFSNTGVSEKVGR